MNKSRVTVEDAEFFITKALLFTLDKGRFITSDIDQLPGFHMFKTEATNLGWITDLGRFKGFAWDKSVMPNNSNAKKLFDGYTRLIKEQWQARKEKEAKKDEERRAKDAAWLEERRVKKPEIPVKEVLKFPDKQTPLPIDYDYKNTDVITQIRDMHKKLDSLLNQLS